MIAASVLQSAGLLNEFSSSSSLERKRVGGKLFGFLITSQFPYLISSCSRKLFLSKKNALMHCKTQSVQHQPGHKASIKEDLAAQGPDIFLRN